MSYQLSKADKKVARACIDKGVDAEFREGLEKFEAIIQEWRAGKLSDNREAYRKLYQAVREKDKAISQRALRRSDRLALAADSDGAPVRRLYHGRRYYRIF